MMSVLPNVHLEAREFRIIGKQTHSLTSTDLVAMIAHENTQLNFHSQIFERCVSSNPVYRRMLPCLELKRLSKEIEHTYSTGGTTGYPIESAITMVLLQFVEDGSDREMESRLVAHAST